MSDPTKDNYWASMGVRTGTAHNEWLNDQRERNESASRRYEATKQAYSSSNQGSGYDNSFHSAASYTYRELTPEEKAEQRKRRKIMVPFTLLCWSAVGLSIYVLREYYSLPLWGWIVAIFIQFMVGIAAPTGMSDHLESGKIITAELYYGGVIVLITGALTIYLCAILIEVEERSPFLVLPAALFCWFIVAGICIGFVNFCIRLVCDAQFRKKVFLTILILGGGIIGLYYFALYRQGML